MLSSRRNLLILGTLFAITAFDTLLLSFATPALISSYGYSRTEAGILGTSLMIGVGIGSIILGSFSDKVGRKPVIYASVLLFSASMGLMSLSQKIEFLAFLLFLSGVGLGGSLTMTITTLPEVIDRPLERYMCYLESFWGAGALMIVVAYNIVPENSLKGLFLAGMLPAALLPVFRMLPDVKSERTKISGNIRTLLTSYRNLTAVIWLIWFCGIYTYYGVFLWLPDVWISSNFGSVINLLIPVYGIQIVSPLLLSAISNETNTEKLLFSYAVFAGLAIILFTTVSDPAFRFLSILLASFFSIGTWVLLILVTQKTYPQSIRGLGVGTSAGIGRIGGIVAPSVTGFLMDRTGGFAVPFMIFAVLFYLQSSLALYVRRLRS